MSCRRAVAADGIVQHMSSILLRAKRARHFVAGRDEQLQQPTPLRLMSAIE
jgi:hypothetical protein